MEGHISEYQWKVVYLGCLNNKRDKNQSVEQQILTNLTHTLQENKNFKNDF